MRQGPLNYIVSAAIVLAGWAVGVIWGASYLGDSVSFQAVSPPEFQWAYRLTLSALALQTMGVSAYWLAVGARPRATMEAGRARTRWAALWFLEFGFSIAGVLVIALLYVSELFEPSHYFALFATSALVTWIGFWLSAVLCSPSPVEYIPWGKR